MVVKHRRKSGKKLGHHDHDGLRRRGHGNKGGFGRSGVGKRSKQKKHKYIKDGKLGYGKQGFTSKSKQYDAISVGILSEQAEKLGTKKGDKFEINVKNKRVLGNGSVSKALIISNYHTISEKAKSKIVKAGGVVVE